MSYWRQKYLPTKFDHGYLLIHSPNGIYRQMKHKEVKRAKPQVAMELIQILTGMIEMAEELNSLVFVKIKVELSFFPLKWRKRIEQLLAHPHCQFVDRYEYLYHYFFCDVIVNEAGGTTLPESFYHSNSVIRVQLINNTHDDYLMDKFPALPQAKTIKEMKNWIRKLILFPSEIFDLEYEDQRVKYLEQFYQNPEKSCGDSIMRKILDDIV